MSAIIVDVEYPNGDMNCTVRAAVDGDDIRFLSTKDNEVGFPAKTDPGEWEKIIFVNVSCEDRSATSYKLEYITGVTDVMPQRPKLSKQQRQMFYAGAIVQVHPIAPRQSHTFL